MFRRSFLFGNNNGTAKSVRVAAGELYSPQKGYGFVTEQNRREQELLRIPELNSAFDTVYWYQDENLSHIEMDENGCYLDSDRAIRYLEQLTGEKLSDEQTEPRRIPLSFKMDVPRQGNYKVTVTIRAGEAVKELLIFAGRRRLAYRGRISAGKTLRQTIIVNVCDIVPRGRKRIYTDRTLDITVVSDKPRLTSVTVTEVLCPTIYIAGDSTLTDQSADYPYAPGTSYSGWGQMITAYFKEGIAVSNHSHSGLTTDSFRSEGHYAVIEQYSKPRDFFFFQFGHNDQKLEDLNARGGYKTNLVRYISECRENGTYPILVTPVARNSWKGNDGSYNDLLEDYAAACLEVGELTNTPVLDLHRISRDFIMEKGLEGVKSYFYPDDFTHNNDYGAYKMAGFVAQEILRVCKNHDNPGYRYLAGCVTNGFGEWLPEQKIVLPVKPAIYKEVVNPNTGAPLLADVDRLEDFATRVDALAMVIQTARFFPTGVYNDMYDDVVGHEWFAGTVECAYRNGIISPVLVDGRYLHPKQYITLEEFLIVAMNGYQSRKRFPEEKACSYDRKCHDYARTYVRAACAIGLLPSDGSELLGRCITRGEAVVMCRAMQI